MQKGASQIGVVVPSFLEGENIQILIHRICAQLPEGCRIVVVDDSPTRSTVDLVEKMELANVETTHRQTKGGRGSAVLEGMAQLLSKGCSVVIEMDADLSHPPEQIPALVQQLQEQNADLLIASRYLPQSEIRNWPLTRRVFSRCSNLLAKLVLRVPISDYTNGYRVYSRRGAETAVETCGKLGKGFIALSEILVNLYYRDFKIVETPTVFINRVRGESSVTYKEVTGALVGLYRIFWLKWELVKKCHNGNLSFVKSGNVGL